MVCVCRSGSGREPVCGREPAGKRVATQHTPFSHQKKDLVNEPLSANAAPGPWEG